MVELTDREKKIVHVLNIMYNPILNDAPFEIKQQALQAVVLVRGFTWDANEMNDLLLALNAEIQDGQKAAFKMLGKYGEGLKGLRKL